MKSKKFYNICFSLILLLYLIFILIFFLRINRLFSPDYSAYRHINIVPFKTIIDYIIGDYTFYRAIGNLFLNIVFFIPAGISIEILFYKRTIKNIKYIFYCSLLIEIIQYIFGTGISDIDDIILNLIGGILGIYTFRFAVKIIEYNRAFKLFCILALIIEMTLLFFFFYIMYCNI